jgi:hypothetical protein
VLLSNPTKLGLQRPLLSTVREISKLPPIDAPGSMNSIKVFVLCAGEVFQLISHKLHDISKRRLITTTLWAI